MNLNYEEFTQTYTLKCNIRNRLYLMLTQCKLKNMSMKIKRFNMLAGLYILGTHFYHNNKKAKLFKLGHI